MTLQQEAYEKIMRLPEDSIRLFIVMADEIARQKGIAAGDSSSIEGNIDSNEDLKRKQKAFQEMLEMRKNLNFPKNFDYKKVMEEAVCEKYGFID